MWNQKKPPQVDISKEQSLFLDRIEKRKHRILWIQIALLVSFFVLWEVAAICRWIDPFIFSQPTRMFQSAIAMIQDGTLFYHVFTTLWETVVGFLLGTLLGTLIAVLLWWNPFVCDVLEPYLVVLNALPKTALAPIIIVWIGNNQKSIIAVALFTSVIVTIMNVLTGFLQIDQEKIKLIQVFGGSKMQTLKKVVFPANIPCILNALKINVGLSFVGVIVGEFLVAQAGLGFLIVYGSQVFKLDWVMLSVIVLAILAACMYQSIALFEKFLLRKRHL
ncbi:ABC transporter permease [Chakrabartyella piscis]|uniref:ABC transporter permease n=1 Tax=Chakrabartyella piscis TaxID=2918914 RepID=UPI002958AB47|nr:ABC transporter permease [Chakrabartyella piscis]